jgi:hypothetical protein
MLILYIIVHAVIIGYFVKEYNFSYEKMSIFTKFPRKKSATWQKGAGQGTLPYTPKPKR